MSESDDTARREAWLAIAAGVRRRVNLGWWLDLLGVPALVVSLFCAAATLWLRQAATGIATGTLAASAAGAWLATALVCLMIARRRFESTATSLVRIEAAMSLRNALSTALAGRGPWPPPCRKVDAGIRWHHPRLLPPLAGSLALLIAGWLIPLPPAGTAATAAIQPPRAWEEIDTQLDQLAREEAIDPACVEETRKQLADLRAQPEDQWFSHHSLEATDQLEQAHRSEAARLGRELNRADDALAAADPANGAATAAARDRAMKEFDQALQAMQQGAMKPNPQLMEQLQAIDPARLANLTPEQVRQLREKLARDQAALAECEGGDDPLADGTRDGEGEGGDPTGDSPGNGAVTRGPGHVPRPLGKPGEDLDTGKNEALASADLTRAAAGDLLELEQAEHEIDRSRATPRAGGAATATGKGGERVWQDSLDPDEQRTVKRFFE